MRETLRALPRPFLKSPRLRREHRTFEAMLDIYCAAHDHHTAKDRLCGGCAELADYAAARLRNCPYGDEKPTCASCPIHCYRPDRRERVKEVMRFSGPRMLLAHPLLALLHLRDERRRAPARRVAQKG
ncbi:MAG TPA: nitrous oxide-stimulated promoter family protein [Thermoanaerobaculia bacterium]|nr:nitrous oxide-stimulated promoter family protein [Thermoanaerobaculia bacterium]